MTGEQKNRARLKDDIRQMRDWLKRLEERMKEDPEGVIPWMLAETIGSKSTEIIYSIGQVNGSVMRRCEEP
jgi:hypothetical protein